MGRLTTVFLTFMFIGVAGFFATQKYILEPLHGTNLQGQVVTQYCCKTNSSSTFPECVTVLPGPPGGYSCITFAPFNVVSNDPNCNGQCSPPPPGGVTCTNPLNCSAGDTSFCVADACKLKRNTGMCIANTDQRCVNNTGPTTCPNVALMCTHVLTISGTNCSCVALAGGSITGTRFPTLAACNAAKAVHPQCIAPPPVCGGTVPACSGTCPAGTTPPCTNIGGVCACATTPPPPTICGGTVPACSGTCPAGTTPPCTNIGGVCACATTPPPPPNCIPSGFSCTNTGGQCPMGTTCRRQSGSCGCYGPSSPPPPPTCAAHTKTGGPVEVWGASGPAVGTPGWQIAPNPMGTFMTDLNNAATAAANRKCETVATPACDAGCKPDTAGHPMMGKVPTLSSVFGPADVPDSGNISFGGATINIIPAKVAPPPKSKQRARYVRATCNVTLYCIPN